MSVTNIVITSTSTANGNIFSGACAYAENVAIKLNALKSTATENFFKIAPRKRGN
jgi:hypothetical protein